MTDPVRGRAGGGRRQAVSEAPATSYSPRPDVFRGRATMFSAASFFDVIAAGDEIPDTVEATQPEEQARPTVVAFYGLKGGAGRTLALAHVAAILADRGHKVAAVDLDLEAPGLHVAFGLPSPAADTGVVPLLRRAASAPSQQAIRVSDHLIVVPVANGAGKVLLLPAGELNRKYLAAIEELGTTLWHARASASPLVRVLSDLHATEQVDVLLLDCRTGFDGLSASVLFHTADLAVVFLPLSDQVWDGVSVLLDATRVSRAYRQGRPTLLFVPSMVPPGDAGSTQKDAFLERLAQRYGDRLGRLEADESAEDPDEPAWPWLAEGIRYDMNVAAVGAVSTPIHRAAAALYGPLAEAVAGAAGLSSLLLQAVETVESKRILSELKVDPGKAYAEDNSVEEVLSHFVAPDVLSAAVDRSTAIVVGAKGAGKTFLWRYLVNQGGDDYPLPADMTYAVGHAPRGTEEAEAGPLQLTADALKELERSARMQQRGTHKAFWLLYGLAQLSSLGADASQGAGSGCRASPRARIGEVVRTAASSAAGTRDERRCLKRLLAASDRPSLQCALSEALALPSVGTLAENTMSALDSALLGADVAVTLTYDGLDTGFETGKRSEWTARQARFIEGLLLVVADARSRFRRLFFKLLLREDIYLSLGIQNKSHLEATKVELRWKPADVWRLALNVAETSITYRTTVIQRLRPGSARPWPADEEALKTLLAPLWGETVEKGKQAKTANYVRRRTSDASERLFPRTLMQVLATAISEERKRDAPAASWRVIGFKSLQVGVAEASTRRVDDLKAEYQELAPYLEALSGMDISGSRSDFVNHMKRNLTPTPAGPGKAARRGVLKGTLHAGAGGWDKVVERLEAVGVLGPYRRRKPTSGEPTLAVAVLYREGLRIRRAGLL